ncbi:MAG TPA: (Fe-S)-binding protein [Sphingomonadales bacterium]|nr:(Fe-S)-binding protein [Sphingomonadales bacterium]
MNVNRGKRIALFPTCLAAFFRPSVVRAAERLLREAGFAPEIPLNQTCCGQPNLNGGDRDGARRIARHTIALLTEFDFVVVPSGSCAGTIINQYSALFEKGSAEEKAASELATKTYELTAFLVKFTKRRKKPVLPKGEIAFHDSCSCFRELRIFNAPRALLAEHGMAIAEIANPERCCGFGGLFSVKFGEISSHLAAEKCQAFTATGASTIVGSDLGCLLNLAGKLKAQGSEIKVRHIAEVLAEETGTPAIGEANP